MEVTFSPIRQEGGRILRRDGDTLVVDGVVHDFATVSEGALLPRDAVAGDWLAGDVTRTGGVLRLAVRLPHGADADAARRFPDPVTLNDGDSYEVVP